MSHVAVIVRTHELTFCTRAHPLKSETVLASKFVEHHFGGHPEIRNVYDISSVDNDTLCYLDLMSIIDDCCANVCAVYSADAAAVVDVFFISWLIRVDCYAHVCARIHMR